MINIFYLIILLIIIVYYEYRFRRFSRVLGVTLDNMISEKEIDFTFCRETLDDKMNHKLMRLYEIMKNKSNLAKSERDEIRSLVADISHQVKTPISNIKMYNNLLLEREVPREKQIDFLTLNNIQISKLDFLISAMVKMSRIESGVITIDIKNNLVKEMIARAIGQVIWNAEEKQINITVNCEDNIYACFDAKWTEEAIVNILDNAVKYTPIGGIINITVEMLENYVAISICDNGIGIKEEEQGKIFNRFYRSKSVSQENGIGVGLFITREIIHKENGFIKIRSELNKGSEFKVYLLKENLSKL